MVRYVDLFLQNGYYVPILCEKRSIDVRPIHCCATKSDIPLECIDEYEYGRS